MKKLSFLLLSVLLIISSCRPKEEEQSVAEAARDELYNLMQKWYLWNDKMPDVNVADYADPYELLEALRYSPNDRWSFVADYDEFMAEMSGSFVGHGFRVGLDPDKNARVSTVYNGSDLYAKGVRRGWIIKTINGTVLAPILIANDGAAYSNLIGPSTAGVTNTFVFQKPDGTESTITTTKSSFTVNTVLNYDTLHLASGVAGYLAFDAFLSVSPDELKPAFSYFKACNVNNIIVDLRYNGGGYVNVAQLLSAYIVGNGYTGKTWINVCYNPTLASTENASANFTTTDYPLGLTRAVFITTGGSASASEVVISSLMPYIDVKLVGSTTHGKPCGMDLYRYGSVYVFAPITFEYKNSLGYGAFYDGIPVNVAASDDITRDFGDRKEASLAAAIALLDGGVITKSSAGAVDTPVIFNERADAYQNLLINDINVTGR